jgi:hypothetical protein
MESTPDTLLWRVKSWRPVHGAVDSPSTIFFTIIILIASLVAGRLVSSAISRVWEHHASQILPFVSPTGL